MGTLSTPFDALLADLHRAKDLYESGDEAARAGAIVSVEAVTRFLMAFRPVADSGLCRPLVALCAALKDLDDGVHSTLLAPLKLGHRGVSPRMSQILVGLAAYTADALIASGLKAVEADDAVAGELRNMGVVPGRKGAGNSQGQAPRMTKRTIRGWREAVSADIGRRTQDAQFYDTMEKDNEPILSAFTPEKNRDILLIGLRSMVLNYRGGK